MAITKSELEPSHVKRIVGVAKEAIDRFGEDKAGRMALAIAYRTLFSLTPLLLISTSIAGFVFREEETLNALVLQASDFLGEAGASIVEDALSNTAESATTTGIVGLALLLWTGSNLFIEVRMALNDIFRVPDDAPTGIWNFVRTRLTGFLAVLALGLLLLGMVALNLFIVSARRFVGNRIPWLDGFVPYFVPLLSIAILAAILALHFQWFTIRNIPWRAAWWGGIITAVLLVIASLGLGWYINSREEVTAGAFTGGAIIVLFLVAALAHAYLFGVEVTRVLARESPPPKVTSH
ncbi:MAG TPA: YihY/virulence factor BrkB family protein, partial [Acidimicrobiia bacterium]|nr:YihY/virulence factor BrkB family protein [Acidimicrobiia bacterium]